VAICTKHCYPNQAVARLAMQSIQAKARISMRPMRVYPCDRCEWWHLTSKRLSGKVPPWDRDPNWTRPEEKSNDKDKRRQR
jgi:hypothetical protein